MPIKLMQDVCVTLKYQLEYRQHDWIIYNFIYLFHRI